MSNKPNPVSSSNDPIKFFWCIFIVVAFLFAGCIHMPAPHLPSSWNGMAVEPVCFADIPGKGRLQIIVAYGPIVENHVALRLVCPGRQVIFWDPGGIYNLKKAPHTRRDDLIVVDPPDLVTYLEFRERFDDEIVEIFEWELETDQAVRLHDILENGTDENHPGGLFKTDTAGFFCSSAVSSFLKRFASDVVTVSDIYFWPNDLARELYTQNPDRVLFFRRNHAPMAYVPPPPAMYGSPNTKSIDQKTR
jgi:hypothetical protein